MRVRASAFPRLVAAPPFAGVCVPAVAKAHPTAAVCSLAWVGHEAKIGSALRPAAVTRLDVVPIGVTSAGVSFE